MNEYLWFGITLAAGFIPGLLLDRTKIPMGGTMGGILGVVILNLLTDKAVFIDESRWIIMLLSGAMIGSTVGREELRKMKKLIGAIVIVALVMIAFNLGIGCLLYSLGGMDLPTALFAATPGGATDMAIIAGELGANTAYVAFMQMARGVLFLLIAPSLFTGIIRYVREKKFKGLTLERDPMEMERPEETVEAPRTPFRYHREDILRLAALFLSAALGGILFDLLDITGGMLIGSILFGIACSLIFGKAVYPEKLLPWQRVIAGAYIGATVTRETLQSVNTLLLPTLIMLVGVVIFSILSGLLVCAVVKLDVTTSLLAAAPCGVTELALLSQELKADTAIVSMVQVARFVIVVVTFPILLSGILALTG